MHTADSIEANKSQREVNSNAKDRGFEPLAGISAELRDAQGSSISGSSISAAPNAQPENTGDAGLESLHGVSAGKSEAPRNAEPQGKSPWLKPYQFKPGNNANPGGRPKKDYAATFARMVLEAEGNTELVQQYAHGFAAQLRKGNAYTFKELAERGYGKLVQRNENTGKDGGPIIVEHKDMSRGDIDERIKQLEIELGYRDAIDETRGTSVTEAQPALPGRTEQD